MLKRIIALKLERKSVVASVIILILSIIIGIQMYERFLSTNPITSMSKNSKKATTSPTIKPTSQISLAPKDKKAGWKVEVENKALDLCPVRIFNSELCTCVLTKLEQKYTLAQSQEMLKEFEKTHNMDDRFQAILTACK